MLERGDPVRILKGPFKDQVGKIVVMSSGSEKKYGLKMRDCAVLVEFSEDQLSLERKN